MMTMYFAISAASEPAMQRVAGIRYCQRTVSSEMCPAPCPPRNSRTAVHAITAMFNATNSTVSHLRLFDVIAVSSIAICIIAQEPRTDTCPAGGAEDARI